jgi:hypothetical protein
MKPESSLFDYLIAWQISNLAGVGVVVSRHDRGELDLARTS